MSFRTLPFVVEEILSKSDMGMFEGHPAKDELQGGRQGAAQLPDIICLCQKYPLPDKTCAAHRRFDRHMVDYPRCVKQLLHNSKIWVW